MYAEPKLEFLIKNENCVFLNGIALDPERRLKYFDVWECGPKNTDPVTITGFADHKRVW